MVIITSYGSRYISPAEILGGPRKIVLLKSANTYRLCCDLSRSGRSFHWTFCSRLGNKLVPSGFRNLADDQIAGPRELLSDIHSHPPSHDPNPDKTVRRFRGHTLIVYVRMYDSRIRVPLLDSGATITGCRSASKGESVGYFYVSSKDCHITPLGLSAGKSVLLLGGVCGGPT